MRALTIFFWILFIFFYSHGQPVKGPIISYGEPPEFINLNEFFVERAKVNNRSDFMDNHFNHEVVLSQILNSGKISFNNELTKYLQQIVDELTIGENPFSVYLVSTNQAITFSSQRNELFVSTGLISQLINPNQLAFYIAREIEINQQNLNNKKKKIKFDYPSFEGKIQYLTTFDESANLHIDSSAVLRYIGHGFPAIDLSQCMDVLLYSHMPFDQKSVPPDYYNTRNYFIPPVFFDVYGEKGETPFENAYDFMELEKIMVKRKAAIQRFLSSSSVDKSAPSKHLTGFESVRKKARYETIRQDIINMKFYNAIYSIFLLENIDGKSIYLDKLKAHAWLGLTGQMHGNIIRKRTFAFQTMQGESAKFFFTLRKLNSNGVASIAIRTIYDLKTKYKSAEYNILWDNLLKILSTNKLFEISKFSSLSFEEASRKFVVEKQISDSVMNKYDKITNARDNSKQDLFDYTEFYLYGIHDLIASDSFLLEFNAYKNTNEKELINNQQTNLAVYPTIIHRKSNRSVKMSKTLKATNRFQSKIAGINQIVDYNIHSVKSSLDYNQSCRVMEAYSQIFNYNQYESVIVPLSISELSQLNENTDYLSFTYFEGTYRARIAGYYLLGLTVVALPFIIPDILLKSFQSKYANLIINSKTGEIVCVEYEPNNEPLTEKLMENRIYHTLTRLNPVH